ncbi:MAG: hypothetical protein K8R35_08150 [Bacteroidales bacterium]|nr:hypothetical protein [Bacteroidales bacterium]
MDKLEKFISNRRDELDIYEPSSFVWSRVEKIPRKNNYHLRNAATKAAMIIILVSSSLLLIIFSASYFYNRSYYPVFSETGTETDLSETEEYYNYRMEILLEKARPLLTANPGLEEDLLADIANLDSICMEIKTDLKDNVSNQEVIEALILNYMIKVSVLEDMLEMLEENDHNSETNSIHEI